MNPPFPGHKLFEELILDFDISSKDRRRYTFLLKNIPNHWLENMNDQDNDAVDIIIDKLVKTKKVPKYAYDMIQAPSSPDKRYEYWKDKLTVPHDVNWESVHIVNFKCSIDTRLGSFYFKLFHKSIALNDFLFMIKRKDSPNCNFCDKMAETMVHLFCDCEVVTPIWHGILQTIHLKYNPDFT